MKKLTLTLVAVFLATVAVAQSRNGRHGNPTPARPTPSILVEAQHGETFYVYADGELVNATPKTQVKVENLDARAHELIVVLQHPARKAAVVQLYAAIPAMVVTVDYDMRRQQLLLFSSDASGGIHHQAHGTVLPTPPVPPMPEVASDQWVNDMVARLRGQNFESERLTTAKGMLNNSFLFTSAQLARVTACFDFDNSKVDFLKAAYSRCVDPDNYETALDVLSFSNSRQEVRAYISSQR